MALRLNVVGTVSPSSTTTLNTYSHLWPTAEGKTRVAASELMAQAQRASP